MKLLKRYYEGEKEDVHLLSTIDQTLLHRWDAFLLLNFLLDLRDLRRDDMSADAHVWQGRSQRYTL
jgi:hypothetical protein